ncbi:MAG TPA: hypothetical protein VL119_10410 [Acidimicrobiia bacterium]|nr:hypothetical protein [Acidimicrobiia bacterium]
MRRTLQSSVMFVTVVAMGACYLLPRPHHDPTIVKREVCTPTCYPALAPDPVGHCHSTQAVACEEGGSTSAYAINMIHFRIDEARTAEHDGHAGVCARAALVAMALATGLPTFREVRRKEGKWVEHVVYKTRWDDELSEADLFAKAERSRSMARELYRSCGGARPVPEFTDKDLYAFDPDFANEAAAVAAPCITYDVAVCEEALSGMWGPPDDYRDGVLWQQLSSSNNGTPTPTSCAFPLAPRSKKWATLADVLNTKEQLGPDDTAFVAAGQVWTIAENLDTRYRCVVASVYKHNRNR